MATPNPNIQIINEIEKNIPILNDKIEEGLKELKTNFEYLKDERFKEKSNETEEEAISRAEGIYFILQEDIKKSDLPNKIAKETIELLNKMIVGYEQIVKTTDYEKDKLINRNNELIDQIIKLEERKTNKLIVKNPKAKNGLKGSFEDKKGEWNERKIDLKILKKQQDKQPKRKETPKKKIEKEDKKRLKDEEKVVKLNKSLICEEMKQIEEWTQMKVDTIVFDSNIDNWKQGTSVFDERILNKSNLIFLIEDNEGNKFGGYISTKINKLEDVIKDPQSFLFSLKSNGRSKRMLKFDIQDPQNAFVLGDQNNESLISFGFGSDLRIYKENKKNESYCYQRSYNYDGINNALCGKSNSETFIPKRIAVIQLV